MSAVWFITGCSRGFGRAVAEHALEQGQTVVATARDPQTLNELVDHAARFGAECLPLALDVTNAQQCAQAVEQAQATFGRIDVLLNNAGHGVMGTLEEIPDAVGREVLETNFFGMLNVTRAVLPIMRSQQAGHILLMTAIVGFANHAAFSWYGASKFACEGFGEALAEDVAPLGIKVSMLLPGPFRTEFLNHSMQRVPVQIAEYQTSTAKYMQMIERINGRQPGNVQKAAAAIYQLAQLEQPPLRLFLGKYAHDTAKKKLQRLTAELAQWETLGLPTDGD
jgi:NAD(P)-dependent dehydrogenase (short-subunit alcohol dehydrogenase family)